MDQNQNETHLKKLASAQDLRGSKSGTDQSGKPAKKRKLWLSAIALVIVLGAAVGIYFASENIKPEAEQEPETTYESTTVKLIDRKRSEIASVTIALPDETPYTVLNNSTYDEDGKAIEKAYAIEGLEDFSLNQSTADTIIGYAANLTATKMITDNAENPADFGLDAPRATVTMKYRDGRSNIWLIGSQAPTSTGSYFAEKGTKGVFLIYSSAVNNLTATRNSLHVCEMPWSVDGTAITNLLVEAAGRDTIEIGYAADGEDAASISTIRLRQPFNYGAHSDRVDEMFTGVAALTISSYAGELDELGDTGLEDGAARVRVTITQTPNRDEPDNQTVSVYRIGNFASADKVYVQVDDTDAVYLTDASNVSFLDNATPGYLVDQFSNLVFINRVDQIDIATKDDSWHVDIERIPKEGDDTKTTDIFYFDGNKVDDDKLFRKLYQEIIGTLNSKLSDDYHHEGEVYLSVRYTLNVEPGELVIDYIEYDEDYFAVRRDGLTLFLIKRDRIDSLIQSLNDYRNGTFVAKQ